MADAPDDSRASDERPTPEQLRAELARAIALAAGLLPAEARARGEATKDDAGFSERTVAALVSTGGCLVEVAGARRVRVEELEELPSSPELDAALDLRRARPLGADERLRLARLYALTGKDEKAANLYRELLAYDGAPLGLAVEVAEAAAAGGHDSLALALAGIDRVAELLLTRDTSGETDEEPDLVRDDPLGAGALLERARDIAVQIGHAPRGVALARAATALYERVGRLTEARESLAGQARALAAAGRGKRARQVAARWRELAREERAPGSEAEAIMWLAEQETAAGALAVAGDLEGEALAILEAADHPAGAAACAARRGLRLADSGQPQKARAALEKAEALALAAMDGELAERNALEGARLDLVLGRVGPALARAEAIRKAADDRGDRGRATAAAVVQAEALLAAGDLDRARKALVRVSPAIDDDATAGRAARVRAELDVLGGRPVEARLLLADAARCLRAASLRGEAAECLVRRAEVAADDGEPEGARRDLKRALDQSPALAPRLELRMELVRARIAEEKEEADLLLEEVCDRTAAEADPLGRALAASARARSLLADGREDEALDALGPALEGAAAMREGLPNPLKSAGVRASPWVAPLVAAATALGPRGTALLAKRLPE
jgi:hypothetical protein